MLLVTGFYQPLNETGKWFVATSAFVGQHSLDVFDGEENAADYLADVTQGDLDASAMLGTWVQLRAGYSICRVYTHAYTESPLLPTVPAPTAASARLFLSTRPIMPGSHGPEEG
jgi:hypothetical protein